MGTLQKDVHSSKTRGRQTFEDTRIVNIWPPVDLVLYEKGDLTDIPIFLPLKSLGYGPHQETKFRILDERFLITLENSS